ncbi:hypothetical protein D3Z52_07695 [Clostridiaceae bacterium]|nr:hypothetical protein [Clostridiaceae bacterium]NBI83672.1 hypothetical protein [Clostridiaceae bacterium]
MATHKKTKPTQPAAVLAGWVTGREGWAEAQSLRPARRRKEMRQHLRGLGRKPQRVQGGALPPAA